MLIAWKSGLRGELCIATEELSHYNYELIKKHLDTIGERWKINPNTECDYELDQNYTNMAFLHKPSFDLSVPISFLTEDNAMNNGTRSL